VTNTIPYYYVHISKILGVKNRVKNEIGVLFFKIDITISLENNSLLTMVPKMSCRFNDDDYFLNPSPESGDKPHYIAHEDSTMIRASEDTLLSAHQSTGLTIST